MSRNFKDFVKGKKKEPVSYNQMFVGFINKSNVPKNKLFMGFIGKKGKPSTKKQIKEELDAKEELRHSNLGISLKQHYNNWSVDHKRVISQYTSDLHDDLNTHLYNSANRGIKKSRRMYPDDVQALHKKDSRLSDALKQHQTPHDMTVYSGVKKSPEHFKPQGDHIHIENPGYTSTSIEKGVADGFSASDSESKHSYLRSYKKNKGFANAIKSKFGMMSHHDVTHPKIDYAKPDKLTPMSSMEYHKHHDTVEKANPKAPWTDFKDLINKHLSKVTGLSHSKYQHDHTDYHHVMKIHVPAGSHGGYIAHHSDFPHENEFLLHKNAKLKIHKTPELDHKNSLVLWHAHLVHDGVKDVGA